MRNGADRDLQAGFATGVTVASGANQAFNDLTDGISTIVNGDGPVKDKVEAISIIFAPFIFGFVAFAAGMKFVPGAWLTAGGTIAYAIFVSARGYFAYRKRLNNSYYEGR